VSISNVENTFGDLLKYLRRRARLTQRELAIAVGYTEAHICRLEKNERLPDAATVAALFIPALYIDDEPVLMERLLQLAAQARSQRRLVSATISQTTVERQVERELGALEDAPALPAHQVERAGLLRRVKSALNDERGAILCGMPGAGKTALAAAAARQMWDGPVFWHTLAAGVNTSNEAIVRQLALFLLMQGQTQAQPLVEQRGDAPQLPLDQQLMLLRAALAQQPALLCFDDVHLLLEDEASLTLLRQLIVTTPAVFLLTSRQTAPLPLAQINLSGLEASEAGEMLSGWG
jgi:transcriptional regulator with XRE-family HTH domain